MTAGCYIRHLTPYGYSSGFYSLKNTLIAKQRHSECQKQADRLLSLQFSGETTPTQSIIAHPVNQFSV